MAPRGQRTSGGLCLAAAAALLLPAKQLLFAQQPRAQPRAVAATTAEAVAGSALRRRDTVALSGALAALLSGAPAVVAEGAKEGVQVRSAMVNVGNADQMDQEIRFWTKAAKMEVKSDKVGADGLRSVFVGYPGSSSGVDIKLDPAVLTRPRPKLLNYDVMQPTVNALGYVQIGLPGKTVQLFKEVQSNGGAAIFGDATYMDAESPRGVAVRLIPREKPQLEAFSLNVEVPAFAPTVKFYEQSLGLSKLEIDEDGPPVAKYTVSLGGAGSGPNMLLVPVPDARVKDRRLDEFEGMVMVADSTKKVADDAAFAVAEAAREAELKEMELRRRLEAGASASKVKAGTKAVPKVLPAPDGAVKINDGLNNFIYVTDKANADVPAVFA